MSEILKPCPFCGFELEATQWGWIHPEVDYCILSEFEFYMDGIVAEEWNTRTPQPLPKLPGIPTEPSWFFLVDPIDGETLVLKVVDYEYGRLEAVDIYNKHFGYVDELLGTWYGPIPEPEAKK